MDTPLRSFVWHGADLPAGFAAGRLLLFLLAFAVALLPALWFDRFDRFDWHASRAVLGGRVTSTAGGPAATAPAGAGVDQREPTATPWAGAAPGRLPLTPPRTGAAPGRLLVGEFRVLVQGVARWWWLAVAATTVAGLAVPGRYAHAVLVGAWVLPVLVWSRLGTQRVENGLDGLLCAYPRPARRLRAEWGAGVALTAVVGLGPVVRMVLAGDGAGTAGWVGGALFVPSLALALGVVSRTHRLFQALYLPLWYLVATGVAAVDYMGAVRVDGRPAGPAPLAVAGLSAALLAVALAVTAARGRRDGGR